MSAGREYIDPKTDTAACLDLDAVRDAISVGLDVEKHVCGDPRTEHVCEFHGRCWFQLQKASVANADVVIAAHQMMFSPLPKLVTRDLGLVIIDESWWQAGLNPNREIRLVGFADSVLRFPPMRDANASSFGKKKRDAPKFMVPDEPATAMLHGWALKVQDVFMDTPLDDLISREAVEQTGLTAENCHEAGRLEWRRQVEVKVWPGIASKQRKEAIAAAAVNGTLARRYGVWLALAELLDGEETHTGRLQIGERSDKLGAESTVLLHSRKVVSDTLTALPILLLDASPSCVEITPYFLPNFQCLANITADAPHLTVTQVVGHSWGRSRLVPSPKTSAADNARRTEFLSELRDFAALNTMATSNRQSLLVTYEAIEQNFAGLTGVATGHFNALRGIDAHGSVGVLFVLGRPLPGFQEHRAMALALTGKAIPAEQPHSETRGLTMADGLRQGIAVWVYADPVCELLRVAITDNEVVDVAGRGRAVNRTAEDPLHIILLTDVVTPLTVTNVGGTTCGCRRSVA